MEGEIHLINRKKLISFDIFAVFFALFYSVVFSLESRAESLRIEMKITGVRDSTQVYLVNLTTDERIDSTLIRDGFASLKGRLASAPDELMIHNIAPGVPATEFFYMKLLMGNETVRLTGDFRDFPNRINTAGSEVLKELTIYYDAEETWLGKIRKLQQQMTSLPDSGENDRKAELQKRIDAETALIKTERMQWILGNFDTYTGMLMYLYYRNDFDVENTRKRFTRLPREMKEGKFGKAIKTQLDFPAPRVGDRAHDFSLRDPEGTWYRFENLRRDYTLLQFAGAGCYYSNKTLPELKALYAEKGDSLSIVTVYLDAAWRENIRRHEIPWVCLHDPSGKYGEVYMKYGVNGTPLFFLVNPDGVVVSTWFGYEEGLVRKMVAGFLWK